LVLLELINQTNAGKQCNEIQIIHPFHTNLSFYNRASPNDRDPLDWQMLLPSRYSATATPSAQIPGN
jgi:hypothetical protein